MNSIRRSLSRAIATRVHNRHLQTRLQIGSSVALVCGLTASAMVSLGIIKHLDSSLAELLLGPSVSHVRQDTLVEVVVIFLLALLGGATLPHFRFLSATAILILCVVFYLSYAIDNFSRGILVQPLYPLLALTLTCAIVMVVRFFVEERPRASLGRLFRRYLTADGVERVLEEYDKNILSLDGIRREVTVLHIDLRDLSTAVDLLSPRQAIDLVNEYFATIVPIIFQHSGTIVKQSGNGIVAVWNLPLVDSRHSDAAVRAALQIRRHVAPLRTLRSTADIARSRIRLGFGIATGPALGGSLGAPSHPEYTIVGEVITVAERLAMKPDRGVFIDRATRDHLSAEIELKEVNPIRLRRKTDPVSVWEVIEPLAEIHRETLVLEEEA